MGRTWRSALRHSQWSVATDKLTTDYPSIIQHEVIARPTGEWVRLEGAPAAEISRRHVADRRKRRINAVIGTIDAVAVGGVKARTAHVGGAGRDADGIRAATGIGDGRRISGVRQASKPAAHQGGGEPGKGGLHRIDSLSSYRSSGRRSRRGSLPDNRGSCGFEAIRSRENQRIKVAWQDVCGKCGRNVSSQ